MALESLSPVEARTELLATFDTKGAAAAAQAAAVLRANHTGTQLATSISDIAEAIDDRVNSLLVAGTGVIKTYDDVANTLTLSASGGGGSGGGPHFVVAATDAHATIKARADYLCDGVADQVQINAALLLGPVMLSGGTFTLSAPILMGNHGDSLQGAGGTADGTGMVGGTVITLAATFSGSAAILCERISDAYIRGGVHINNLRIKGDGYTATAVDGIKARSYRALIHDISIFKMSGRGIYSVGNETPNPDWNAYDTRFHAIHVHECVSHGIQLQTDQHLSHSSFHTNGGAGIYDAGASNQITQVHCYGNDVGVHLYNGGGVRSKYSNCKIEHHERHGFWIESGATSGATTVQIDNCGFNNSGKSLTDTYSHIATTGPLQLLGLQVIGCKFSLTDGVVPKAKHCIDLNTQGINARVIGNTFQWSSGVPVNHQSPASTSLDMVGNQGQTGTALGMDDYHGTPVPTAAMQASAGTTPPAAAVSSTSVDTRGRLTTGTGTTPAVGAQVIVSFSRTRSTANYRVAINAINAATALLNPYVSAQTTTGFTISFATAPAASQANTVYGFDYVVVT